MLISTYIYKFLFIYSYICNIYAMPCNFLEILIRVLDCDTPLHILPLIHSSLRWIGYVSSKGENHRKLVTLPIPPNDVHHIRVAANRVLVPSGS